MNHKGLRALLVVHGFGSRVAARSINAMMAGQGSLRQTLVGGNVVKGLVGHWQLQQMARKSFQRGARRV